jgi:adenylyltransferase/sulfurtransferase
VNQKSERYSRQVLFAPLSKGGQDRLASSCAVVVGCGALGSVSAMALVRAGVGTVRLIDRDFPELSNLQRQVLFDEDDVSAGIPKSVAAAHHLKKMNSEVIVVPIVADITHRNAVDLLGECDVIIDGTDNFETRYLLNEVACQRGIPWVHGGAIGAEGRVMTVIPGQSACLRCLVPDPPQPGTLPTCDTSGILGTASMVIGALQATEAIKLLSGNAADVITGLTAIDLWTGQWQRVSLKSLSVRGCPTCREHDFPWLEGRFQSTARVLCGREAVQIDPLQRSSPIDLEQLAKRLSLLGRVVSNPWLVRFEVEPGLSLSIFSDGRTIVSGTREEPRARALVARYLGA